ncbi:hypothetical protein ABER99_22450 [Paenibacillus glucanolyticus]|uniref:hypothetical protein n=1 Tax=Paenibacillus glucanolyticus TaxID=59843 RepID=UPI0013E3D24B|nr:hypothetical protein [Paenibacillus glucanolyticus]
MSLFVWPKDQDRTLISWRRNRTQEMAKQMSVVVVSLALWCLDASDLPGTSMNLSKGTPGVKQRVNRRRWVRDAGSRYFTGAHV